ncbi:TPT domain-containing protein [Haematococcus lacustris]|uniref:TPT domain-containing protein n=1 Tax=Haematococcus lacustris TaxID=44745 RepID=A0A699Z2G7_HAELA|nr:TPT domain-containing protein [Haematococcus lacustris]
MTAYSCCAAATAARGAGAGRAEVSAAAVIPSTLPVRLVGASLVTGGGVALASYGQLQLSLLGLACMMASGLAEGVHGVLAVFLQMVSDEQVRHPLEILMYVSSGCTLCLTVQVVFWELWPVPGRT